MVLASVSLTNSVRSETVTNQPSRFHPYQHVYRSTMGQEYVSLLWWWHLHASKYSWLELARRIDFSMHPSVFATSSKSLTLHHRHRYIFTKAGSIPQFTTHKASNLARGHHDPAPHWPEVCDSKITAHGLRTSSWYGVPSLPSWVFWNSRWETCRESEGILALVLYLLSYSGFLRSYVKRDH